MCTVLTEYYANVSIPLRFLRCEFVMHIFRDLWFACEGCCICQKIFWLLQHGNNDKDIKESTFEVRTSFPMHYFIIFITDMD